MPAERSRGPVRRGKISDSRRHDLILAAFRQIAERGFEGLRTREVAAEVGVNIATLHYYFPTKEALIRGVIDYATGRLRSTRAPHGSPADQLRNHLRAMQALFREEPRVAGVMAELALRSNRDPALARILRETNDAWHKTLRGLLRRGAREGHLAAELDSDGIATLIMATLSSMTLPTVAAGGRMEQAFHQLETLLRPAASRSRTG